MKKLLKIFLILIIACTCFMTLSTFAVETKDSANTPVTTSLKDNSTSKNNTNNSTQQTTQTNSNNNKSSTQVSTISSVDEGALSVSDIINILLIATGVVIILLAIAILIRLK